MKGYGSMWMGNFQSEQAGRSIRHLHADTDRPVLFSFPEGAYLRTVVFRVTA